MKKILLASILLITIICLNAKKLNSYHDDTIDLNYLYEQIDENQAPRVFSNSTGVLKSKNTSLKRISHDNQKRNNTDELVKNVFRYIFIGAFFIILCIMCILGNILVIISVFTYRPLQNVQNMFIVSLAVADLLVCILCVPFHIITEIANGVWLFGPIICQFFITSDILLCTASILNLCCIALDRYWAIKDSIKYAQKRTFKRVIAMIIISWISSVFVSVPGILWNTKDLSLMINDSKVLLNDSLTTESTQLICYISKDKSYRFYSSFGTFYIPLIIMTFVYLRIYLETKKRLGERAKAAKKLANSIASSSGSNNQKNKNNNNKKKLLLLLCPTLYKKRENLNSTTTQNYIDNKNPEILDNRPHNSNNNRLNTSSNNKDAENTQDKKDEAKQRKIKFDSKIDENEINDCYLNNTKISLKDSIKNLSKNDELRNKKYLLNSKEVQAEKISNLNEINFCSNKPLLDLKNSLNTVTITYTSIAINTKKSWTFNSANTNNTLQQRQKISLTRERRAARTLGIIMGAFTICWAPFFCVYLLESFNFEFSEILVTILTWLGYVNSALNPLIYTIFNLDFRISFKRILFNCVLCKK